MQILIQPMLRMIAALLLALGASGAAAARDRPPLVLGAASLQESLTAAAHAWARAGHAEPTLSFAASSALARQVESGAPADLFISADEEWMTYLDRRGLLKPGTRTSLLGNRLVLIAPKASRTQLVIRQNFPLLQALGGGRLAMADPDTVPAGRYGKAALVRLGVWPSLERRVAGAENVRAALALVERGEAPLGIVYETDARASRSVRIVGWFPQSTYPVISYPLAILANATSPDATAFRAFLLSARGKAVFRGFGFSTR